MKHLIYDCILVQNLWRKLGQLLKFDINWRHIAVGFHFESNDKILFFNEIISFTAFFIYKFKMKSRFENTIENENLLLKFVKKRIASICIFNPNSIMVKYKNVINKFEQIL